MSIVTTDTSNYSAIANAIRAKGVEGSWKPSEMAPIITALALGGGDYTYVPSVTSILQEESEIVVPQYHGYVSAGTANNVMTFTFKEPTTQVYYFNVWGYSSGYSFNVNATRNGEGFYGRQFTSGTPSGVSWSLGYADKEEIPIGTEEIVVTVSHSQVFSSTSFVRCAILDTDSILLPENTDYSHVLTNAKVDTTLSSAGSIYHSKTTPAVYSTTQGYLQFNLNGKDIKIYTVEGEEFS